MADTATPGELQALNQPPNPLLDATDAEKNAQTFSFSEKSVRLAFIRKVYGILTVQLAITFGLVAIFVLIDEIAQWTLANPWLFYVAMAVNFVAIIVLACCESFRRKSPWNFVCLGVLTIAEGFMLGTISTAFSAQAVLLAVGITAVVCLALSIFAFQTKLDFTVLGGFLYVALVILSLFGLFVLLLRSFFPILHILYAAIGALLFSFYLVYDIQLLLGGKHKYKISPEEYIFAALNIYLDIINIFLFILEMFQCSKKR